MKQITSQLWAESPSGKKTWLMRGGITLGILLLGLVMWRLMGLGEAKTVIVPPKATAISLGDDLIEDDLRKQIERDRAQQEEANAVLASQMSEMSENLNTLKDMMYDLDAQPELSEGSRSEPTYPASYPQPPSLPSVPQDSLETEPMFQEQLIGGIAVVSGAPMPKEEPTKKKTGIYMSPGFMEGMLLTGLKAETIEGASENPEPMIIRVQAPAVLPNAVKANLKGCFVIAHGFGKLNKERIEARLVSLHCLNRDQEAVIDEKIKGFVVDADGSKGIAGQVVTKAGANTARMFVAGMLSGFGEGIEEGNSTGAISPLGGSIETASSSSQAIRRGMGKGISKASQNLSDVFLELVKQSSPVIEVGPAKAITLSLTEGVYLRIRDLNEFGA